MVCLGNADNCEERENCRIKVRSKLWIETQNVSLQLFVYQKRNEKTIIFETIRSNSGKKSLHSSLDT